MAHIQRKRRPIAKIKLPKKTLTIDRKTWHRGKTTDNSELVLDQPFRKDLHGKRCCLGFEGEQIWGLSKRQMKGIPSPAEFVEQKKAKPSKRTKLLPFQDLLCSLPKDAIREKGFNDNKICCKLMETNDRSDMTEAQREKKLTALFKKRGITVKFIN